MVKNAVIIPVGAKGGFVGKRLPDPTRRPRRLAGRRHRLLPDLHRLPARSDRQPGHRRPTAASGSSRRPTCAATTATTRTWSSPPTRARRPSATSPTASRSSAASGSATRSRPAARSAMTTRRWASPPAARGSRSSTTSASSGSNTQAEPFTVVGIGDMSGDVFGNGMLLSDQIKLVAAFDHRHIFLDPDPDPAASIAERRRLFELPRSSWADYDAALISAGGGVYAARPQVDPGHARRSRRGSASTADADDALTPTELIHAILQAPVDLLWNGGIGTYVKASTETERRGRRPRQRRRAGGRARAAVPGRRRGRQPRADPARPHRVRAGRRADQHRRDRQLGRRRHLRPRGEPQDPARSGRRRRRDHAARSATSGWPR